MAADNCNTILDVIRHCPGRTRPELGKLSNIKYRNSVAVALKNLQEHGFVEERREKYWPIPDKKGRFVPRDRNKMISAQRAIEAGQEPTPEAAAILLANDELRRAKAREQGLAEGRAIAAAEAKAAKEAALITAPLSMFEQKSQDANLSPAEKLGRNLNVALDIDAKIMELGVDRDDPKTTRLVGEASGRTLSTAARVDETQLKRDDYRMQSLDRLLGLLDQKYDAAGHMKVITNESD